LYKVNQSLFEIRHDSEGEYYNLVTAWKPAVEKAQANKLRSKAGRKE
jgi:hypothetical protein